jgi:carbohydrate-binding DOMON domain-containing protein
MVPLTTRAWDYTIWAEGWTPGVYKVGTDGKPVKMDVALKIVVDPVARAVTLRVPKDAIPGDPKTFGYLGVMLGQEGFPAAGVWRVRDVEPNAAQWRFGGGAKDTNHTRIIDVAWDGTPGQEELLSKYKPSQETALERVPPDDFAQLKMVRVK